jgi:transcriptional regulator with XRE-family HTH domain
VTLAAAVAREVSRRARARGMSQNALARAADMAPTLLHRAVKGQRNLQLDELDRIARALGVTPEHLIRLARTSLTLPGERSE